MGFLRSMINGVKKMMGISGVQETLRKNAAQGNAMRAAILRWKELYDGHAAWLSENALSLGLPVSIARETAITVTLESKVAVTETDGEERDGTRAAFLRETVAPVLSRLEQVTERACALGGVTLRPYIDGKRVAVDVIGADDFYPIAFNARGEITECVFIERRHRGEYTFIRAERHILSDDGYRITNEAYRAYGNADSGTDILGTPCPLSEIEEWADIDADITLTGIASPLYAYFKMPLANNIDSDSNLGVSVYANADASGLLREADKQFQRLSWEYEGGELAVDAAISAFDLDEDGKPKLPVGKERLFRMNALDGTDGSEDRFRVYSPALRDANYYQGLNRILQRIEDACGISRGTLSEQANGSSASRTATELKFSRQRTYATVTAIQMALQDALEKLIGACDMLATLYSLAPEGDYETSFKWDDSIVIDAETERNSDRMDVADGLMQAWEYRVKWYGESEEAARQALEETMEREAESDVSDI